MTMKIDRRTLLGALPLTGLAASVRAAPTGPLRMVIPWAPGGSTDVVGRHFADHWSRELGQTVVVENRSGASGTIGHAYVANGPADGSTVLLATNSTYAIAPSLLKSIPYEHEKVFAPVTLLARSPLVLCVNAKVPVTDIGALITLAKEKPTELNMGIGGTGATSHMASELFMAHSGTQFTLVSYRGSGQTVQAIAAGEIDVAFLSATTVRALTEQGLLRVLGTTGTNRSATLPAVPPIAESGLPQFEATTAYALFVPIATPKAEIQRLHEAAVKALGEQALRDKLAFEDIEIVAGGPDVLAAHVREETAKWAEVIRARNISL
jgi:tripartite-type tricarboxylate transporter receptor subunit TctC